jgi:hypothetical protein
MAAAAFQARASRSGDARAAPAEGQAAGGADGMITVRPTA